MSGCCTPRSRSGRFWLACALLALAGAADLISVVYRQTILQTYAPDEMRGRLQGVFTVVVAGGPRLGDVRSGTMASAFGLTTAWTGTALACIPVALLIGVAVRPFWHYRTQPPEPGQPAAGDTDVATAAVPGMGASPDRTAGPLS